MKSKAPAPELDDLLRPCLTDTIDMRHEFVRLDVLIDLAIFWQERTGFFPSHTGRLASSPRLVAGLLNLHYAGSLSDKAAVACWVENPFFRHFCGETVFQYRTAIDPVSLVRWRGWIVEEGVEWRLMKKI